MAKFRVNQKVRIAGTLFCVIIKDVFDDGENSKYAIEMENGAYGEATESELRLPLFEAITSYVNTNTLEVLLAAAFVLGFMVGAIIF